MPDTTDTNQNLHAQAKKGITLLMGRQVILQVLTFAGGIVLARKLGPAQFGLYAIATFLVGTFGMLGDFGLAPSFIQRKEELTDRDLRVAFTLQQGLTTVIVVALLVAAPWLASLYPKSPPQTVWLVRTLAFSLYLTSWRSMSALQLERRLHYDRLAGVEVVETLSYQGLAVVLALAGYGVWSFVWATLARGVLGTVLTYAAAPWPIRLGYDKEIVRGILRFGIPFQLQNLANHAGDWIVPALVGSLIGPQAVGYLTWASSNGKKPLILVDNVMRVAFPHFSRLQDDETEIERTLTRYLTYLLLAAGLWFAVLAVAGPLLVKLIYTDKWIHAVPSLIMCAAALGFDVFIWVFGVTFNSLGRVRFTTRAITIRAVLYIALSIILVLKIGFIGVPLAYLLSSAAIVPVLLQGLERGSLMRVLRPIAWVLLPTVVGVSAGGLLLKMSHPLPLLLNASLTVSATVVFFCAALVAGPQRFRASLWQRFRIRRLPTAI